MGNNTSVLIKYSNKNRYKFQWYAEFLKFIGYFVCEYLKEDRDSEELLDATLDMDEEATAEKIEKIHTEYVSAQYIAKVTADIVFPLSVPVPFLQAFLNRLFHLWYT